MESGVPPCAACGDDAHAACRACSYALCKACLDEDAAEGRTTCARCGGEYGAPDPAHGQGAVVEEEVEESHEPAAGGVRERVTMASQLSDHQDEGVHARTMSTHARTISSVSGVGV
ncbi:hypothetical protein OsJ_03462 [Oryza sativa Japonica Group]|nr:hypothetical protein OsJ_03462 [Oryza sativa Japonica Group]